LAVYRDMSFKVVTLDEAKHSLASGPERFEQLFHGIFLLAIGRLRARQIDPTADDPLAPQKTMEYPALDLDKTLSMSFGERLTHAMQDHPLAGCTFFLSQDLADQPQSIGRRVGSDLTVPDASVSDHHCDVRLVQGGDLLEVTDRGSTNGTSINLRQLTAGAPAEIQDEEILTVGRYGFQLLRAQTLHQALLELVRPT
jgi:FHA domain